MATSQNYSWLRKVLLLSYRPIGLACQGSSLTLDVIFCCYSTIGVLLQLGPFPASYYLNHPFSLIPSATSLLNLVSQSITFLFRQGFVLLEGCICWIFLKSSGFRRPHYSICRCFCYKFCTHQLRACDDSFQFCGSQTYLSCSVQE